MIRKSFSMSITVFAVVALLLTSGSGAVAQGPEPQEGVQAQAALGTAFTYQGQLKQGGNPVNGLCDMQFSLFAAASGGTALCSRDGDLGF